MRRSRPDFVAAYLDALRQYLSGPEETGLAQAHELGRKALREGLGVLDITTLHCCALEAALQRPPAGVEPAKMLEAFEQLLLETLSPFEMAHRGFWEANVALRRLNDVLEGQARRIAAQLHDESAQMLAAVHFALADIATRVPGDTANALAATRGLLDQIEQRLRTLAHELRPPILENLGLVPALEFLAETVSKRWSHPIEVRVSVTSELPDTIESTLYRIVQEALTNVTRHAHATRAQVVMTEDGRHVVCSIRDDGVGMDEALLLPGTGARGIGLFEIQERVAALGGTLHVRANSPQGTDLTVEIPLGN